MNSIQPELQDPLATGLIEGPITKLTPEIRELAQKIQAKSETQPPSDVDRVRNICMYIKENFVIPAELKNRPHRLKRTAHEILFPDMTDFSAEALVDIPEGKKPIGTCTEHGKALRALLIATGIPTIWVETLDNRFIEGNDEPSGHIFLEIYLDNEWYVLDTTAHPNDLNTGWLTKRSELDETYYFNNLPYTPIARGLDSRQLWLNNGSLVCFDTGDKWYEIIEDLYPRPA